MVEDNPLNYSFSGLKTALLYLVKDMEQTNIQYHLNNIAASYQECIIDTLLSRLDKVHNLFKVDNLLIVGGVSCNKRFRYKASSLEKKLNVNIVFPKNEYCTDNAAMIATAGWKKNIKGIHSAIDILPYSSIE